MSAPEAAVRRRRITKAAAASTNAHTTAAHTAPPATALALTAAEGLELVEGLGSEGRPSSVP